MNILVTGGAGFIGSHTVRELLLSIVFDNLSTGHSESVAEKVPFVVGKLHNRELLASVFRLYSIDAVGTCIRGYVHLSDAGFKVCL